MSLPIFLTRFGYPALIVGLLLEGETVLVLAAFLAHRGYLNLPLVLLLGCLVSFASDQFFFWMGRTKGRQLLERRPSWNVPIRKATALLGRNTDLLSLGLRFMYGLRTALPFMIGVARLDPRRFAVLDFVSAVLWALTFGLAGQLVGHVMEWIFEDVREHEPAIIIGIVLAGAGFWVYRQYVARKEKRAS